jgi:hypothetical protein
MQVYEYKVSFKQLVQNNKHLTICHIVNGEDEWFGVSSCNPVDEYNENKGNMISLDRALHSDTKEFDREMRSDFWFVYFMNLIL